MKSEATHLAARQATHLAAPPAMPTAGPIAGNRHQECDSAPAILPRSLPPQLGNP